MDYWIRVSQIHDKYQEHASSLPTKYTPLLAIHSKDNNKIVSVKHNNILIFILTFWRQVSVVRPSSGEPYKKF